MVKPSAKKNGEQSGSADEQLLKAAEALDARWPQQERAAAESRSRLLLDLDAFRTHLRAHFEAEEQSGYLADALSAAPRLAGQVSALRQQHTTLANSLDQIIAGVRAGDADAQRLIEQGRSFHRFLADLRHHEQAESALVLEAFDEDIGTGD